MADFSSFSSSSFTTSDWINNAVKEKNEEESLESYLAQLAMKLHIISQDYTDQLETGLFIHYIWKCSYLHGGFFFNL